MEQYIGKMLDGRYEVKEIIGVGGMAVIYRARCHVLNRDVAIKILKKEFAQDKDVRHRFYIESQAVAKLSHPNIVSVYDVNVKGEVEYIVMELVEGITLKEYLDKKGAIPWKEAIFFSSQIARALAHAHGRGIIHRDVKPQNIMLTTQGQAKVTDFGIASFTVNQETRVIQDAIGSVHYISPEQAKGITVDERTDIYSLGVVMYEMLTGKLPFEGDTAVSIVMQHISAMPLRPSEVLSTIPKGMDEIVMHAMCPTLNQRYANIDEIITDMTAIQSNPETDISYQSYITRGTTPELHETQTIPEYKKSTVVSSNSGGIGKRLEEEDEYKETPRRVAPRRKKQKKISPLVVATLIITVLVGVAVYVGVNLLFGTSTESIIVEVDDFIGMNIDDVMNLDTGKSRSGYDEFSFNPIPTQDNSKESGLIFNQEPEEGTQISSNDLITLNYYILESETMTYTVPSMQGRSQNWVENTISTHNSNNPNLQIELVIVEAFSEDVTEGQVISTDPGEGAKMESGETITVTVSAGPEAGTPAPDLINLPFDGASNIVLEMDLKIKQNSEYSSEYDEGVIFEQDPEAGDPMQKGQTITVTVSNGPDPSIVEEEPTEEELTEEGSAEEGTTTETTPESTESTGSTESTTTTQTTEPTIGSASLSVLVPEDERESARIVVKLDDGSTVYDQTFSGSDSIVVVSFSGSGTRYATAYVNGESVGSTQVVFK